MNRWLWLSVLWFAGMMYALLLHQGGNAPLPFAHFDKVVHAALFFGQFWLLAKVFLLRRQLVPWQTLLLAALVLAAGNTIGSIIGVRISLRLNPKIIRWVLFGMTLVAAAGALLK